MIYSLHVTQYISDKKDGIDIFTACHSIKRHPALHIAAHFTCVFIEVLSTAWALNDLLGIESLEVR